jgi:hypothetical protein
MVKTSEIGDYEYACFSLFSGVIKTLKLQRYVFAQKSKKLVTYKFLWMYLDKPAINRGGYFIVDKSALKLQLASFDTVIRVAAIFTAGN